MHKIEEALKIHSLQQNEREKSKNNLINDFFVESSDDYSHNE